MAFSLFPSFAEDLLVFFLNSCNTSWEINFSEEEREENDLIKQ